MKHIYIVRKSDAGSLHHGMLMAFEDKDDADFLAEKVFGSVEEMLLAGRSYHNDFGGGDD